VHLLVPREPDAAPMSRFRALATLSPSPKPVTLNINLSTINRSVSELADPKGELIVGWQQQHDYLWARYADVAPWERVPQVMWRGRIADGEHPDRDSLRCVLGFRRGYGHLCWLRL